MSRRTHQAETVTPGQPRWLTALAYAALATAAICYPVWPGQINYDGLHAYGASITGVENAVWPPLHAYLFWLSRTVGLGIGGLFVAQTFLIFFGVALSAGLMIRTRAGYAAALAAFAALVVLIAPMLGVMLVHWRDVTTASFAMTSLACWLLATRFQSRVWLALAALALGGGVAMRYNAFSFFALIAPLMVWRPFLDKPAGWSARATAVTALVISVGLAWASLQWRLPDFKRLPAAGTFTNVQVFDLLGVSACDGRSWLPPAVTRGQPLTGDQVRKLYDPRHSGLAFKPHPGLPQIYAIHRYQTPELVAEADRAWREVLPRRFGCYLAHRNAVFVQQMGLAPDAVFYPTHGGIDANPYGFRLARPALSQALTDYVWRASAAWWRRPIWLYLGAAVATTILALRRDAHALLAAALLGGAVAGVALLYLVAPEADARHIFPGNVFCALVIAIGLARLAERAPSARGDGV
jgi:hypothetical protein